MNVALWRAGTLAAAALVAGQLLAEVRTRTAPLTIRAPAIAWSARRLALTIEQQGVLEGKRLAVFVFVDGNMIGRVETSGTITEATLTDLEIGAGGHELLVKAGTMEARTRFRRLPAFAPVAGVGSLGAVGAIGAIGFAVWLRRRRRAR